MAKEKTPADNAGAAAPKGTSPRDYLVCRETTAEGVAAAVAGLDGNTRVLVVLGPASAKTPKAARIEVAKAKCSEGALKDGIELNAVAAKALDSGRKTVKLETQPKWDA